MMQNDTYKYLPNGGLITSKRNDSSREKSTQVITESTFIKNTSFRFHNCDVTEVCHNLTTHSTLSITAATTCMRVTFAKPTTQQQKYINIQHRDIVTAAYPPIHV